MILLKRLVCREESLILVTQTDEEAKIVRDFAEFEVVYQARIERTPGKKIRDIIIRKEKR